MTFDTLATARALQRAGMENGQAEAVANAVRDATADLVTKADLDSALAGLEERLAAQGDKLFSALAAQEGRLRGELYKALWGFGLGIIGVNIAIVSAAVGVALWVWPPGAG